jgi:thymidylate synthase
MASPWLVSTLRPSFAEAYCAGLRALLEHGAQVPSVVDPNSKASNFGRGDRPAVELLAYTFGVESPRECLASTPLFPVNVPYCFGLLAWTLDGRNDVESLAYYRAGALEFSDDGYTLSGAFGHRLFGEARQRDQIAALVDLLRQDPGSRRTFAAILTPEDNFVRSKEYPCAIGCQLFWRGGQLQMLTHMRAQQALTVLPYDVFLFMNLQMFIASTLKTECGAYLHSSGTFHIYENERTVAANLAASGARSVALPRLEPGSAREVAAELIALERSLRDAVRAEATRHVEEIDVQRTSFPYLECARAVLVDFAMRKLEMDEVPSNWEKLPAFLREMVRRGRPPVRRPVRDR